MYLNKTKWVMLLIALCFAFLQALQPFIHAHLDINESQHDGIHVGLEHEELLSAHDDSVIAHLGAPHAKHTISVDPGIKHDVDMAIFTSSVSFVLFFICLTILFQSVTARFPQFTLTHTKLLKRQPQSVRAPPQF